MSKDFRVEFRTGFWWLLLIIVTFLTLGPLAVVFRVILLLRDACSNYYWRVFVWPHSELSNKTKNMLREISKLIIFVVAFAMPVTVARMFDSPGFLWLYGVSAMFVLALHNHYETLERIDIFRDNDNDERDSSAGN